MDWTLSRDPTPTCNPLCRFFRCGKGVLDIKRNPPWCNWVNSECIGYKCPYATCAQLKLLPDGRCALFVKRKTEEREIAVENMGRIGLNAKTRKKLQDYGY